MPAGLPRIVVLDRDGVINRDSADHIRSVGQWQPLPGSLEAIARLCRAGIRVAVATNQSGLGRGLFSADALKAIHARMSEAVATQGGRLDGIFYCPHHPDSGCECRKPRPGLLHRIERELGIPLAGQPVVGDSPRDIEAALAVGAMPILVRTGNGARCEADVIALHPVRVYDDLAGFVDDCLREAEA